MLRALLLAFATAVPACSSAQQAVRPAITGIAFARFYTTDTAGAEHFYGDVLGLARVPGQDLTFQINSKQAIQLTAARPPGPVLRMAAVGFTTRDTGALEQYLHAHGVVAETHAETGSFSVRDPEGNLIFFVTEPASKSGVAFARPTAAVSARIIHVGFVVHDADKENGFWQTLLGFRPYWHGGRTDGVTDYMSMQVPDGTDWLEYMLNTSPTPTLQQNGGADHVSLGVEHMTDVVAQLARNHCETAACSNTKIGRDGKVQLNLFDPDLTRVELMEFTPTRDPCCSPFTGRHPSAAEER